MESVLQAEPERNQAPDIGATSQDAAGFWIGEVTAMNQFWHLSGPNDTKACAEWAHDKMRLEAVKCPINEGHQRAGRRLTDLTVTLPGKTAADFVWTWYSECLIQDHVLQVMRTRGFTGFEVKPVTARFRNEASGQAPKLWELVVTGWAGLAAPESGIKLLEHCPACQHMHYSAGTDPEKLINEGQWDGSDFFIVWPLPMYLFTTERVTRTIRDQEWSGLQIHESKDIKFSPYVIAGFSPGRLSYVMPERRAKELGQPLGIY